MAEGQAEWRPAYRAERAALVRARLRWCATLTLLAGIVVLAQVAVVGDGESRLHVVSGLAYVVMSAGFFVGTMTRSGRRHGMTFAMAHLLALATVVAVTLAHKAHGPVLIPAVVITLVLGTTLLIPLGAARQAIVSFGAIGACFAAGSHVLPGAGGSAAVILVFSAGAVSVAGARLVEQYRSASFERSWQQERLMALTRALVAQVDVDGILAHVAQTAPQLVAVDQAIVALRDPERHTLTAQIPASADPAPLVVPDDLAPVRWIVERGTACLPEDDPSSPIVAVLREHGVAHVAYATLRHGDDVLGILAFVRRRGERFTPGERALAQGIADQVAVALRTAHIVRDLRQANQMKSVFVSTMSHELRTPLNVILGYTEMLEDEAFDAGARRELLDRVRASARDLLELVDNTLAVGRIEAGRDAPVLEPVVLGALWGRLAARCGRVPRRPDVTLAWSEAPAVEWLTDARKLEIVVANLVGNACKFTERGRIDVTLALDAADHLVLTVRDTGIGIAESDRETVFDMFRQADSSNTRRFGGTGLGLYIVRRFVDQLGGTITLESAPGAGSTFRVRIPPRAARISRAA